MNLHLMFYWCKKSLSRFVNICQYLSAVVNSCQHLSTLFNSCQHLSTVVNSCQLLSTVVNNGSQQNKIKSFEKVASENLFALNKITDNRQ